MSTSVAAEEGLGKTQEESKEVEKSPVKTAISGTGSVNEDASKELETNGSIEVDIETTSPKKPPAPLQNEEKSEGTAESNPIQRSQQNNVHNNNNNNNQPAAQQNSNETKNELNTAREATPPPTVQEKKEEVVVKKNEQPIAAETPSKNSGLRPAVATAVNNHKEEEAKKEEAPVEAEKKQGLPKWMVQSANAPPSPSPEATEKSEEKQETATATPAKGRGRGRRSAAQKAADAAAAQQSSTSDDKQTDSTVHRPRRSTRTRVDYANPDPMTVVAEADDEEPGGAKRGSAARAYVGRMPAVGGESKRGRKRKVAAATSGEDEEREEDDDDEEYGSKKKAKKRSSGGAAKKAGTSTAAAGTGKRRGRPAGSGNKAKAPKGGRAGRPATGGRRKRKADQDSDDEHAEVVYDDRESDKETTGDESAEEGILKKTAPIRAPPTKAAAANANKSPPKKRGRPPTKGKQSKTGASVPAEIKAAEQTDESAVGVGSGGDEPAAADTAQLGAQA